MSTCPRAPRRRRFAALTATAVVAIAGASVPAAAAANPENEFGGHVVTCAQGHGFDGFHNPGMHQGRSGWTPDHVC